MEEGVFKRVYPVSLDHCRFRITGGSDRSPEPDQAKAETGALKETEMQAPPSHTLTASQSLDVTCDSHYSVIIKLHDMWYG